MTFPRISGVLNNCLLHSLTPELREKVKRIANAKSYNRSVILGFQPIRQLKTVFASFYRIDPDAFSWKNFADLLEMYDEFDLQILLGPVLRQFMADTMQSRPDLVGLYKAAEPQYADDATHDAFISYKTTIQHDGRYASISPDEASSFLFAPLGFKVTYHQNDQVRTLPEDGSLDGTMAIEIFHQGGIDGAQAGGHWERTNDEAERTEFSEHTHFHRLASLLRNDDAQLIEYYVRLLRAHVSHTLNELRKPSDDKDVFHDFELTLAQIEKFLYNRLYVGKDRAQQPLGQLTQTAQEAIAVLPNIDATEYDDLFDAHFPLSPTYKQPLKITPTAQQYKILLTLLTPPVAQLPGNPYVRGEAWSLRANEISVLNCVAESYVEYILFEEGLSQSLYDACAQEEIVNELPEEFFHLLVADPEFVNRASRLLREKAQGFYLISTDLLIDEGKMFADEVSDPSLFHNADYDNTHGAGTPKIGVASSLLGNKSAEVDGRNAHPLQLTQGKRVIQSKRLFYSQTVKTQSTTNEQMGEAEFTTYVPLQNSTLNLSTKPPTPLKSTENPQPRVRRETSQQPVDTPQKSRVVVTDIRTVFEGSDDDSWSATDQDEFWSSTTPSDNAQVMRTWRTNESATANAVQTQPPITADFWLRAAQFFLCLGGTLAIVAVLTSPPVAASLGITQVLGVAVADVAVTATFGAIASALTSLCMFALRQPADPLQARQSDLRLTF